MPRVHVLPLGSLDAFDAQARWYAFAVDGGRARAQMSRAGDVVAMAAIARNHPGAEITCAPELADAAPGCRSVPWTEEHRRQAAVLAVRHVLALPFMAVIDDKAIARLIDAAAELARAHVPGAVIRATFTQQGDSSLFHMRMAGALILDAGDTPDQMSIDVFRSESERDAYVAAQEDLESEVETPDVAHATLHLLAGPPGLQAAMLAYTGQPFAPAPLVHDPEPDGLDDHDVRWLASLAFAAAEMLARPGEAVIASMFGDADFGLGTQVTR